MMRMRIGNKILCLSCKKKHDLRRPVPSGRDPEALIREYGAAELSKTSEGRMVLRRAGEKYKAELVQPGDPEFKKLYGKQHRENEERRRENEAMANKEWKDRGYDESRSKIHQ